MNEFAKSALYCISYSEIVEFFYDLMGGDKYLF